MVRNDAIFRFTPCFVRIEVALNFLSAFPVVYSQCIRGCELIVSRCIRAAMMCVFLLQYLVLMMGMFAFMAWIGSLIDNLFLTYLLGELY